MLLEEQELAHEVLAKRGDQMKLSFSRCFALSS